MHAHSNNVASHFNNVALSINSECQCEQNNVRSKLVDLSLMTVFIQLQLKLPP